MIDLLDVAERRIDLPSRVSDEGRRLVRLRRPVEVVRARGWEDWTAEIFPEDLAPYANFHRRLWDHSERITAEDSDIPPYAAIWFRSAGKTSTMVKIIAKTLAERRRRFWVVACAELGAAKERVNSIKDALESDDFRRRYPLVGEPAIGTRGGVRAWSNRTLITASGQVVQAASMRAAARGMSHRINGETIRPDGLWGDDVDEMFDSELVTRKKLDQVRRVLIPLQGRRRLVFFFTQTMTLATGVAAGIVTNTAGFARTRILDGPVNAVEGLSYRSDTEMAKDIDGNQVPVTRYVITDGVAQWEGLPLEELQRLLDDLGLESFLAEYMNDFGQREGAMLKPEDFVHLPEDFDPGGIHRKIVAVDPSGGAVEHGVVVVGASRVKIGESWREVFYVIEDLTVPGSEDWTPVAILAAARHRCDVLFENNGVGAGARRTLEYAAEHLRLEGRLVGAAPEFYEVPAVESKEDRAMPAQRAYRERRVFHVRHFPKLEREWCTFVPGMKGVKSPNRIDALAHGVNWLSSEVPSLVQGVGMSALA